MMLGSVENKLPPLTLTSSVKDSSPFLRCVICAVFFNLIICHSPEFYTFPFLDYIDLIDLVVSFGFGTNGTIFVVQTLGGGKKFLKELPYYPAGAVEIPNVIPERMITIGYNVDFPLGTLSLMSIGLLCFLCFLCLLWLFIFLTMTFFVG